MPLDLLGATNLIPSPNSTKMAIHIDYVRAGWRGSVALPALVTAVTLELAYSALGDGMTVILALAAIFALIRPLVGSTWLIIGGAIAGLLRRLAG